MIDIVRKLFTFLDARTRLQVGLILIPMLITAILEMASIGMILPFIQVIMGGEGNSGITDKILSYLPDMPRQDLSIAIAGVFAVFFVIKNAAILCMVILVNWFTNKKMALFLQRMFDLYLHRSYLFHLQRNSADIQRNLNYSVPIAFDGLRLVLGILLEGILVAGALLLLLLLEPVITLVAATSLGVLGVVFFKIAGPYFRRWGYRSHDLQAESLKHISDSLGTIKDIKLLGAYGHVAGAYRRITNAMAHYLTLSISAQHAPRLFVETLVVAGFMLLVLVMIALRGSLTDLVPILGLFGMAAMRLMPSMNRILHNATELRHRMAPIETLHRDLTEGLTETDGQLGHSSGTLSFEDRIIIEGLTFTYPGESEAALHEVDVTIPKGQAIGLVGASGAGKTTLIDVFLGFLVPGKGRILVDGGDVLEDLTAWRNNLGYVPQHIYLTDDTLRRNIALGVSDESMDEERIQRTIKLARLDKVIESLPKGLDTVIGEQGARLSGGQRQRVGIARALYRDPEILVFDEATSSLDNETEMEISAAIESLSGTKTVLIIAHRLSTVRNCDKLLFMKSGRVVDEGTFEELSRRNGDFRTLVNLGQLTPAAAEG